MKKIILLTAILTAFMGIAFAQSISIDEGRIVAQNIIAERFPSICSNQGDYKIIDSYTETNDGIDVFYVYNFFILRCWVILKKVYFCALKKSK